MRKFLSAIVGCMVMALGAGTVDAQEWDDGGLMAFEDLAIDEAVEGDLPELDDDDFFLDDLMEAPADEAPLPAEDPTPPADDADDDDDLFALLDDWEEAEAPPADDAVAEEKGLDAAPDDADDWLGQLGLEDDADDVVPPEPDVPVAETPSPEDDLLDDDALFDELTAVDPAPTPSPAPEPEPTPDDELFDADLDLWASEPDFDDVDVADEPPAPALVDDDLDDLLGLLADDEPTPAPAPDPEPFEDDLALDDAIVGSLIDEARTQRDEEPPQDFDIEDMIRAAEAEPVRVPEPPPPPADPDPELVRVPVPPAPEPAPVPREPRDPAVDRFATQEQLRRVAEEAHGMQALRAGEQQLANQELARARVSFEEALRFIPDRPDREEARARARRGLAGVNYMQAIAFERAEDFEQALAAATQARNHGYVQAEALIRRIRRRMEDGPVVPPPRETRRWEEESFRNRQAEVQDWLKRGREAYLAGEYQRAYSAFGSVLARDPQNKEAIRMRLMAAQKIHDRATMEVDSTRERMVAEVREAWNPRDYAVLETVDEIRLGPGTPARPDEPGRERIMSKMNRIRLPEIDFRQANIRDVVDFLHQQSVEHDPTDDPRRGVNLILRLGDDAAPAPPRRRDADPFAADPFGAPAAAPDAPGGERLITFSALDVTLKEALDIVVDLSRLKYRIRGSVVMIVPEDVAETDIIHRMYDVLPTVVTRFQELGAAVGLGQPQQRDFGGFQPMPAAGAAGAAGEPDWKTFFTEMGVEWPARSSIRYVPQIGKLIVANTAENLAVFERVLSVLNVVPFQIEIEARFVEVQQTDIDSLGLEWLLTDQWQIAEHRADAGLPLSARRRIVASSDPQRGSLTRGNRFMTRSPVAGETMQDNLLTVSAMLTNPELSLVLHALQQRGHTDLLSAPKITTKSGQEAVLKVVTEFIYPTEFETEGIGATSGAIGGETTTIGAVVTPSAFQTREVGVILRVVPRVTPEGQMIDLDLHPEVVSEPTWRNYGSTFTSFDPAGNPITQELNMEQPFFHTRSLQTSMLMYNGATVVMGGMITESRVDVDDKVPLLGDIPILGRLFRSQYQRSEKRNLLIFVTARLVDPSGRALDRASLDMQGDVIADALTRRDQAGD